VASDYLNCCAVGLQGNHHAIAQ